MPTDRDAVRSVLAGLGLDVTRVRATAVRESRYRPVTRYAVQAVDRATSEPVRRVVLAKGYYRGGGAATFAAMNRLWQDGFGSDRTLTIPEPIGWARGARLLLQSEARGRLLYDAITRPDAHLQDVRRAARWLAKLHASALPPLRPQPEGRDERKVRMQARIVGDLLPTRASDLQALAEWVVATSRALSPATFVATHGDYQPKNIYVARAAVTVIDLDRFALAHPSRDVGHFLAQSATMSYVRTGGFTAIARWNAAFVEEYAAGAPTSALVPLATFHVRTMLEILYYKLHVRPARDPSFAPAWIDDCLARAGQGSTPA